jgi:putative CocE/NonD family hydrolase
MNAEIRVEFDVQAAMRDGTVLRANVYRPADDGTYPVVLVRTPYGKDFGSGAAGIDAVRLTRAGYIVALQDVRGRFRSDGEWVAFQHEAEDGHDSVEWAAQLPGSTGAVGMVGASYLGFTQWAAAMQAPPHLKALLPIVTWADMRDGTSWRGGVLELGTSVYWQITAIAFDVLVRRFANASPEDRARAFGLLVHQINTLRKQGYHALPLKDFAPVKALDVAPELDDLIRQPFSRDFAAPYSVAESYDKIRVPAYNIGGWYDIFTAGTLRNFSALRERGVTPEARQGKVLMGAWSHSNYSGTVGDLDFGFTSSAAFINLQTDITGLAQRWFDHWLKGIDNGITAEPPVKLFIMGDNVWRDEQEWPLARAEYTPFYLRNGGAMSRRAPDVEPPDHYTYDPNDPTPTDGGNLLMHPLFHPGVRDQRPIEARADVLSYTSDPVERDLEVTGPIVVTLYAASDALDTDFVARLVDVHPDGFAQNLADGIIRARYRDGDTPELLQPGRAYEFTIDLWSTANVFKPGHRIRLDVASASFPRWDRNPNTGAPFGVDAELRPARQTILHDGEHPSHVLLPVIPR